MSNDIEKAIDSLYSELESLNNRIAIIKTNINNLSALLNKELPFKETDLTTPISSQSIRPDQFFRKGLATSVKEFLKMKNGAATAKEIFEALKAGGYEFDPKLTEPIQFRGLTISLGKNTNDFVFIKSNNSYGLVEFYPEKKSRKRKSGSNDEDETKSIENEESNK